MFKLTLRYDAAPIFDLARTISERTNAYEMVKWRPTGNWEHMKIVLMLAFGCAIPCDFFFYLRGFLVRIIRIYYISLFIYHELSERASTNVMLRCNIRRT